MIKNEEQFKQIFEYLTRVKFEDFIERACIQGLLEGLIIAEIELMNSALMTYIYPSHMIDENETLEANFYYIFNNGKFEAASSSYTQISLGSFPTINNSCFASSLGIQWKKYKNDYDVIVRYSYYKNRPTQPFVIYLNTKNVRWMKDIQNLGLDIL